MIALVGFLDDLHIPYLVTTSDGAVCYVSRCAQERLSPHEGARTLGPALRVLSQQLGHAPERRPARVRVGELHLVGCPLQGSPARLLVVLWGAEPAMERPMAPNGLTPREVQVAELLATAHTTKEAAAALGISPHTVRRHSEHIFAKLGVRSRSAVVLALAGARRAPLPSQHAHARGDARATA